MVILLVVLEVGGELVDLLAQHRNLNLRRTGVRIMPGIFPDNSLLFLGGQHGKERSTGAEKTQGCDDP